MFADAAQVNVLRDNGRWTLTAPRRTLSRPAVWGDRVYVLVDGHAAALDRADGSVLWRSPHRVGGELESRQMEFTATGGHLVVPSDRLTGTAEKAGLSVLDAGSGALCWQSDAGPLAAYHTDRRTLVTVHRTGIRPCRITALDLATGTRLWQREVRSLGTAVLAAGRLITFGEDEQGYGTVALDLRSGAERWRDTHFTTMLAVPPAGGAPHPPQLLAWNWIEGHMRWLSLKTGRETGAFEVTRQIYRAQMTNGSRNIWVRDKSRRVHRYDTAAPADGPSHTFHPLRRGLMQYRELAAPGDGWLYAIDRARHLLAAPIGPGGRHLLPRLRWPASVPRRTRRMGYSGVLTAGPGQVYVVPQASVADHRVVALRDGGVLWRLPHDYSDLRPVPTGDGVLLTGHGPERDRLRLVDADTGAAADA